MSGDNYEILSTEDTLHMSSIAVGEENLNTSNPKPNGPPWQMKFVFCLKLYYMELLALNMTINEHKVR